VVISVRNGELARQFLELSYFRLAEVTPSLNRQPDAAAAPGPFKVYRHRPRVALHQPLPLRLGTRSHGGFDDRTLSTLLYYGYGVSRYDCGPGAEWRYHRFVASARCLFPVELYVVVPGGYRIGSGAYHYDSLHHALTLLAPGDHSARIAACLKGRGAGGPVLVLSTYFAKTAYRYEDFAYRLVNQEAGLTVGNVLLVADALGVASRTLLQFHDDSLNDLLGLAAGDESAVAAIALDHEPSTAAPGASPAAERRGAVAEPASNRRRLDAGRCARLLALDRGARLTGRRPPVDDRSLPARCAGHEGAPPADPPDNARHAADPPDNARHAADPPRHADLAEVLRIRSSGDSWFRPEGGSIPAATLSAALERALAPIAGDTALTAFSVRLHVVVNRVDGVASGVYEWCATCRGPHQIREGDLSRRLQALYFQPAVNCALANFVAYVSADFDRACTRLGDRAYRMGHVVGGVVAQRISVAGAALGLTVRCSDAYDAGAVTEMLELREAAHVPIFALIAGRERPGASGGQRYRHRLVL
jgi:SagB-type dehydrogenase family enzyme